MARLKIRYSLDEIIPNQYTFGGEWMTEDSVEYIGLYHKYTTGEVYTKPVWDSKLSKKLVTYVDTNTLKYKYDLLKYNTPKTYTSVQPYKIVTTLTDYNLGYITRYFCKKRNESIIIEVSELQYNDWISMRIDNVLYDMITLKWYIAGSVDDEFGVVTNYGVQTKNKRAVDGAEKQMPGISLYLTNYLQFYSDTDFIVPKDINF
jgi:hypothetical protein